MKKVLMGTTALVALGAMAASPAAAEDPIKLSVGGYYQNVTSFVSQDVDNSPIEYHEVNSRQEGEIHFKGETMLDNGLTVGFQAQLEAVTQGDQIDETFLYFQGDWGRLVMGSENSAAYLMQYTAPSVALGLNSPNFFLFALQGSSNTTTYINNVSDANKITYFSPRFGGFQLGASYTPNSDVVGGDRQTAGLSTDNDVGDQANWFSIGANFVESFNGVDVAVAGGYEHGSLEANVLNVFEDSDTWSIGANVGFAGVTVGGSYYSNNNGLKGNFDATAWDAGASYSMGPWGVSIMYFSGQQELAALGEDEHQMVELGASYALGPGIKIVGSVQHFNEDNAPGASDSDGWGAAVGTMLSF